MSRRRADPAHAKVRFSNREGMVESVWCTVVDAARGLFRVNNLPMFRQRPTYNDVIVATEDRDGSRAGAPHLSERRRWTMAVDPNSLTSGASLGQVHDRAVQRRAIRAVLIPTGVACVFSSRGGFSCHQAAR